MSTDSDDGLYFVFDPSCIVVTDVLGKGGFGTVHRGTVGERQVAVKTFHSNSKNPGACQETYERELHVLRLGLRHENLVRILGATCIEGWQEGARIVMDYAGHCSLQTILDDEDTKLDMDDMVMFGVQMVSGLQYLQEHGILHLELKPANFMFSPDSVLKLGAGRGGKGLETERVQGPVQSLLGGFKYPEPATKYPVWSEGLDRPGSHEPKTSKQKKKKQTKKAAKQPAPAS
nr:hypothetical protein BaRGS_010088 [Batillaria attramentaria]